MMNPQCDIYIEGSHVLPELRFVGLFDKAFVYVPDRAYSGYIGASLPRLRGVLIVSRLRSQGSMAFNMPIAYRNAALSQSAARRIAEARAAEMGWGCSSGDDARDAHTPMYWTFATGMDENAGARIFIDKLDGHVWNTEEHELFMYDYNNVLD